MIAKDQPTPLESFMGFPDKRAQDDCMHMHDNGKPQSKLRNNHLK